MNITVLGAGYVGLVTGACFAELGNHVVCVDINAKKIAQLRKGILPIYEPGLDKLVENNIQQGRLKFHCSIEDSETKPDVIFIAVGTPSDAAGAADISYVLKAAEDIGNYITDYCVIVDKSTVPVGMAEKVTNVILNKLHARQIVTTFDVVSNPEFLREGAAIEDFMQPDRVIIGLSSTNAKQIMLSLYLPIMRQAERIYFMSIKDAEMTKYAANAMLATRISFMNEIALLCEKMDVDVENVRIGIGSDVRIGAAFLNAGCGYGGSCFPKDVRALIKMANEQQFNPLILNAVEERNKLQKEYLGEKVRDIFGDDLSEITLAVWGLSFKPETDDMREASSAVFIDNVIKRGAKVLAYDPAAMAVAREVFPKKWFDEGLLQFVEHQYAALKNADALVLVTEWKPFCYPDIEVMKKTLRQWIIIDGRNQYDPKQLRALGFQYTGIGRGKMKPQATLQSVKAV